MKNFIRVVGFMAISAVLVGCDSGKESNSVRIETPVETSAINKLADGAYKKTGNVYVALHGHEITSREGTHDNTSGEIRYISGQKFTLTTSDGVAKILFKAKSVDRISMRSIDVSSDNVDLVFIGNNGTKASFGSGLSSETDFLFNKIAGEEASELEIFAVRNGKRFIRDCVVSVRLNGKYLYFPIVIN